MVAQSAQQLQFDFLAQLPVVVQLHKGQISSDAGLLPVRQFDSRWKYTRRMVDCLTDLKPNRRHSLESMLRQRVFGILAGYEDCNDHDTLRDDPVFKMIAGKMPEDDALASQPTLSRFENQVTPSMLMKLIISEPTTRHVFVAWLRFGTAHASLGADDDLMKVVNALRKERPDIKIHVRGDAGFGLPLMYEVCENNGLTYTFGFSSNARLKAMTEGLMDQSIQQYSQTKQKARLFDCFLYKCDSWSAQRTVIAKAECHVEGTNRRFVVTNLPEVITAGDGEKTYDDYIQRGESEHRMNELKNGVSADRLSCHRFMANFFRLLLHTAAFNLLNALRDQPNLPPVLKAGQPCTWRMMLIKVAAEVVQTTRRVVVRLAAQWPWWPMYQTVAAQSLAFNSSG